MRHRPVLNGYINNAMLLDYGTLQRKQHCIYI